MEVKGPERNISSWNNLKINLWGITKAGHTSLKNHLFMLEHDATDNPGSSVHGKHRTRYISATAANTNGHQNITMVRNPIDRFRSGYKDFFITRKKKGEKIAKNLKLSNVDIDSVLDAIAEQRYDHDVDPHFRRQCWYLEGFNGIIQKIEEIQSNWTLPLSPLELKQNVTQSETIKLNQRQIEKIKYVYKKDFKLLNYVTV